MTDAEILATLDPVDFDPRCVVEPDVSAVVRHAAPVDDAAREAIALQRASRLVRDDAAVAARERRIAVERGGRRVLRMPRRA